MMQDSLSESVWHWMSNREHTKSRKEKWSEQKKDFMQKKHGFKYTQIINPDNHSIPSTSPGYSSGGSLFTISCAFHISRKSKKLAATKSRHLSTEEVETDFPSAKENGQTFLIDIQTFVLHCLTIASWSYYEEDLTSPCCNGKILPAELWQSMRQGKHWCPWAGS